MTKTNTSPDKNEFAAQSQQAAQGFAAELWYFLKHNKKWWLTPIIVALLLVSAFVVLSGSAVAPFIYTLF